MTSLPTSLPTAAPSSPARSSGAPITVVAPSSHRTGTSSPAGAGTVRDSVIPPATGAATPRTPTTSAATSRAHSSAPAAPTAPSAPAAPDAPSLSTTPGGTDTHGTTVVIDPGHNGANAAHPEIIHKQVPAGFGAYKNCNTTGTSTNDGYPEHRFNWKVSLAVKKLLQAKGITVIMTRDSDKGVGPCVNERAAIGNTAHADAVVSIHGDGERAGIRGFFVMTASRAPAGKQVAMRTDKLAEDIRDGLAGAGFPISNALGVDGLWARDDLAGLNLSRRPTVMIECGNMRNAAEAATMTSAKGQQRYAQGIATGVLAFLRG